jgi:tRNA A22 N-methylase
MKAKDTAANPVANLDANLDADLVAVADPTAEMNNSPGKGIPARLGNRLEAIVDLVKRALRQGITEGDWILADIGSDHAYLPAFLLRQGLVERAIATEIHEGPYQNILRTIGLCDLEGRLEARRGDGLSAVRPGEAKVIVLAGMGGATIEKILRDGAAAAGEAQYLVLQPQNAYERLCHTLLDTGWKLVEETLAAQGQEIYRLMLWQNGSCSNCEYEQGWDSADIRMHMASWRERVCPSYDAEGFARCIWRLGPKNIARCTEFNNRIDIWDQAASVNCQLSPVTCHKGLLERLISQELAWLARAEAGLSMSCRQDSDHKRRAVAAEKKVWEGFLTWLFP